MVSHKAKDLVKRDLHADSPGTKVFTDITQMLCRDGKLYFCGVLDAFDGTQIGYSMADPIQAELCTAALMNAKRRYGFAKNCIVHSDRGNAHRICAVKPLRHMGCGSPWDQPAAVLTTLALKVSSLRSKKEVIYRLPMLRMTKEGVRAKIFAWIEGYYIKKRRNTANQGNSPPRKKREAYNRKILAAQHAINGCSAQRLETRPRAPKAWCHPSSIA